MAFPEHGTDYQRVGSPRWNMTRTSVQVVQTVILNNALKVEEFGQHFLGKHVTSGGTIQHTPPQTYPGKDHLICTRVDSADISDRAVQDATTQEAYNDEGVFLDIHYETTEYSITAGQNPDLPGGDPPTGAYSTVRINGRAAFTTSVKDALQWELTGKDGSSKELPVELRPGVPTPEVTIDITWHNVPEPNWDALLGKLGARNAEKVFGLPKRVVLYTEFGATRQKDIGGNVTYELNLSFAVKVIQNLTKVAQITAGAVEAGWGFFLRDDPAAGHKAWQQIVEKESGDPVIPELDFDDIVDFTT